MEIIERWQREVDPLDPNRALTAMRLRALYESLATQLFWQYEPTKHATSRRGRDFLVRLNEWLRCFKTEPSRWAAFRSIEYMFFVGQQEFEELYRSARSNILFPWLVECAAIDIFGDRYKTELYRELKSCWICPITDSLRINGFLHITNLTGKSVRPDWISLQALGDPEKIDLYRADHGIKYLVLVEDFVGAGEQIEPAVRFARQVFPGPIIVIPLLICAPGDERLKAVVAELDNVEYRPVLVVESSCLLSPDAGDGEPPMFESLRDAAREANQIMRPRPPVGPFGRGDVGSLTVLYSNCPNNVPPMYYFKRNNWTPIFPRLSRG